MKEAPRSAGGHIPFPDHRTLAEVYAPCSVCDQVRTSPCRFSLCPKAAGGGQAVADPRPVALLRWTEDGELQLGMFGDGIRMLVIDEQVPHDRVYEVTHREQLHALDALIPPGTEVGHAGDERHEALVARMTALFNGKPHLRAVSGGADQGGSAA